MPRLPQYDSQRQLITQQPQFLRTGAGERRASDIVAEGLGKIADIAIKWNLAVDTVQTTTAKANFSTGALDILNRAENDADYNNSEQYYKEIEKLKENSLKGFANRAVAEMAALDIGHDAEIARIKIENIYKKKIIEAGQVNALRLIDLEKSNYINAVNDKGKIASAARMKSIIGAQVAAGIFGRKAGDKLYKDSIKEAQQTIKDQEGIRKKQEKEMLLALEFAQNQREAELVEARVNNTLTVLEVRTAMEKEEIGAEFAQALMNSLKSPKTVGAKTDPAVYMELVDMIAADVPNHREVRQRMLQEHADGKLSVSDFQKLYTSKIAGNEMSLAESYQQLLEEERRGNGFLRTAVEAIKKHFSTGITAKLVRRLIDRVIGENTPDDKIPEIAKEEIRREIRERNPSIVTFSEKGQLMIDANGNRAIVYPDGTYEEVE